jgi:uncharacterized cupredoxin-like copper-binding protein
MLKRYLAIGLVTIMSLGILAACGSSNDDSSNSGTTPGQSSNAPAIFTATAQSEIEDTWTPTPEPVHEETVAADETGGDSAAAGEQVALQISAVDIAFDVKALEGPADTDFTITLTNNGAADHDFVIEGTEFTTEILAAGESQTITVNLPAGEYTFFCSVPGHRPAGMEGTLTITAGGGAAVAAATDDAEADVATADDAAADDSAGGAAAAGAPVELQVSAVDIAYDVKELEAPANTDFTITLTNNGMADHNFVIEGTDFTTAMLSAGETDTITVNLPAGEYTFFCSVPGHRQAGMEGTLIISEGGGAAVAPAADDSAADDTEGDAAAAGAPVELQVSAIDIAYDVKELEGPADTDFTITVTNNGAADHDFVIEGTDFKTSLLRAGQSETITVNLPAGEYTFFCSVPGHRPAGMEGTLTITEGGGASVAPSADDGEADDAASDEPVELQVTAVDIDFLETELEAPADTEFTITLTNNGMIQHDFRIEGTDFRTELLNGGETETLTITLPAGEYTYYCSVPGHRAAGMEGTLIVSEGGGAAIAPADESDDAAGGSADVQVSAVDIAYEETELEGPADTQFTITVTNNGNADHDFVIEGTDFKTALLAAGESETITVTLPAGEYTFFCSVPGHRPAGMEGTLVIK